MGKTQITTLAEEWDINIDRLIKLKTKKLLASQYTGTGKNTWITEDGVEVLRLATVAPLAVATQLMGLVLHPARNPLWVFCKIDGKEGKWPVLIHRKDRGRITGKRIAINQITDTRGTTYIHNAAQN